MMAALPPPPPIVAPCPAEARSLAGEAECGWVRLPLDRSNPSGKKIRIYFERYSRGDDSTPPTSTVVSIEGGPGYPVSIGRADRVELWRPVSKRRDLVLIDLRGTGRSEALACKAFAQTTVGYIARAGRCAKQVGPERDFYSTAQAVQDMEDVLVSLSVGQIDLYGDSYGTYAAQAYALRFPARLRSLTLDAAYPLPGTDPAWADLLEAIRRGLQLACDRWPGCPATAEGTDPVTMVAQFASRVRNAPILGFAPDGDGTRTKVRLNEDALVQIVSSGYWYPALWRDLLAAIASARRGDRAPILRLAAETVTVDAGPAYPRYWSEALYLSVICHDYPQLWDFSTPIWQRRYEADTRLAAYPPGAFLPFTVSAWTQTEYEGVLACLRWPSPAFSDPPDPPGAPYPSVPTLVMNGDLDTIVASSHAQEVANRFPNSTFVEFVNSFHVIALADRDDCGSRIYIRFLRNLDPGDTSCAQHVAEVHTISDFPRSLDGVKPAATLAGDASTRQDRRLAAAAAHTVADAIARWMVNYDGTSVGLRGGRWSYTGIKTPRFTFDGARFVPGVEVFGSATWSTRGGDVVAHVTLTGPRNATGRLRMRWSLQEEDGIARIHGFVKGRPLAAMMPAP